jgi:hypothetical protein
MPPSPAPIPPRPDLPGGGVPSWQSPVAWPRPARRRKASVIVAIVAAVALFLAASGAFIAAIPSLVRPKGSATDHEFLFSTFTGPARWNPCEPIHYTVNLDGTDPSALDDVAEAVRRISSATGVAFIYDGTTDERPVDNRDPVQPDRYGSGWAPVLIAWAGEDETDIPFETDQDEQAVAVARPFFDAADPVIVTGWIVVNEDAFLQPGFSSPGSRGVTVLHELGHIMGLGHTDSEAEVMHPSGGFATDLGPGDRVGLAELGIEAGCLDTPRPF